MPFNNPDPTDPNMLIGVELPATSESTVTMAYVFAEEFARIGFDRSHIIRIFSQPFYAGANQAYEELGEQKIERIVDECLAVWSPLKFANNKLEILESNEKFEMLILKFNCAFCTLPFSF